MNKNWNPAGNPKLGTPRLRDEDETEDVPSEFERFEDLTRTLVQVPKSAITDEREPS